MMKPGLSFTVKQDWPAVWSVHLRAAPSQIYCLGRDNQSSSLVWFYELLGCTFRRFGYLQNTDFTKEVH